MPSKPLLLLTASLLALAGLPACSTVQFYAQALQGQMEVFDKARPIATVRADASIQPLVKQRLDAVGEILAYAHSDLHLPSKGQYERYTDLNRPYVVWVVYAAPEFGVEGKTWWYPFVGSLEYRGFFNANLAEREAERWRHEGYDVFVGGVTAYSTLGVFRDPLLNTFIGRSEADLAELIFHELTHQRLYLSGDTDFNEALATAVGREGTRRWLTATNRQKELRTYSNDIKVEKEFVEIALATRERLRAVYAQSYRSIEAERAAKAAEFARLRERLLELDSRYGGSLKMAKWFEKPVNNARLNTIATYYEMVPGFEALIRRHDGDLESFFEEVRSLKSLSKERRHDFVLAAARP